jgi:hypothetical protein
LKGGEYIRSVATTGLKTPAAVAKARGKSLWQKPVAKARAFRVKIPVVRAKVITFNAKVSTFGEKIRLLGRELWGVPAAEGLMEKARDETERMRVAAVRNTGYWMGCATGDRRVVAPCVASGCTIPVLYHCVIDPSLDSNRTLS